MLKQTTWPLVTFVCDFKLLLMFPKQKGAARNEDGDRGGYWPPSSHGHTDCTATHGTISSEKYRNKLHVGQTRRKPALKGVGKGETHSHHKSHPWHEAIYSGGNSKFPTSPWEAKGLEHTPSVPTLRLPPWDGAPKHLALRANGACVQETHRTTASKEAVLNGHTSTYSNSSSRREVYSDKSLY